MSKAPTENNERFREDDPRISDAAKAAHRESVLTLRSVLTAKKERMDRHEIPEDPRAKEQFSVVQNSVDARLELIRSMES